MSKTSHKIHYQNSQNMSKIEDESVDLVVTSPPYAMVQIWDEVFAGMNQEIGKALKKKDGTIDDLYDYWILGKDPKEKEPRWCVLRDVLGWIN